MILSRIKLVLLESVSNVSDLSLPSPSCGLALPAPGNAPTLRLRGDRKQGAVDRDCLHRDLPELVEAHGRHHAVESRPQPGQHPQASLSAAGAQPRSAALSLFADSRLWRVMAGVSLARRPVERVRAADEIRH